MVDLEDVCDVHAVQVNFADEEILAVPSGEVRPGITARYIEEEERRTRWVLEGSSDGKLFRTLVDKSQVETDLAHDFVSFEKGEAVRFLRLTVLEVPFG